PAAAAPARTAIAARPATQNARPVAHAQTGADAPCPTCAAQLGDASSYVYAIGRVEARFPTTAIEKEFAPATSRADTKGKTDRAAFHTVLSQPENRYLARQLCWVFTIQGLDTYILTPGDPGDLNMLIDAIKAPGEPETWLCCVIGMLGPTAPPTM